MVFTMTNETKNKDERIKNLVVDDKGRFEIITNSDQEYPGIDIEFIPNDNEKLNDNELRTNPRILFEFPKNETLRILIWDKKDSEDFTKVIEFDTNTWENKEYTK